MRPNRRGREPDHRTTDPSEMKTRGSTKKTPVFKIFVFLELAFRLGKAAP